MQAKAQKARNRVAINRRMSEIERASLERRKRNAEISPEERKRLVQQDLRDLGWD